ncbi:MAG: cytochrome P450, partial [Saprospiraceae bacterium]
MSDFPPIVPRYKGLKNIFKILRNPIPVLQSFREEYGDTYAFYMGGTKLNVISFDPEFCQHVLQKNHRNYEKSELQTVLLARYLGKGLLTSNGNYWLQQRRLIQPGFHRDKLTALTRLMNEEIEKFIPRFEEATQTGQPIEVYDEGLEMAFNIMCRSLFTDSMTDENRLSLKHDLTAVQEFLIKQIRLPFLSKYFHWTGQVEKARANSANSHAILTSIIEERRKDTQCYDDLLDMLLSSRYEDTGEGMNDEQVLAETQVLFAAGHETSANSIAWTLYLLAKHPQVVKKLRAEFAEVLEERPPEFSDLRQLSYTMQVINESMRLYPPAWITDRMTLGDDEVAGWKIPKGT